MGVMDRFLGSSTAVTTVANAATGVAEVFRVNETRKLELDEEAYARAINQLGQEFQTVRPGFFDGFVNGLNRLPRPLLALGTMALFIYAMVEPQGFSLRMVGLQQVPEPLWWLLGAIVGFYFGAREAHHFRHRVWPANEVKTSVTTTQQVAVKRPDEDFAENAALRDWVASLRE